MNDFALSVNSDTHPVSGTFIEYMDCGHACDDDIGNQIFSSFTHYKEICTSPSESESSQTVSRCLNEMKIIRIFLCTVPLF